MCDYSLQNVRSRPAKVGDKLETKNFGTGTTGFCDPADPDAAVCLLPGTELAFDAPVTLTVDFLLPGDGRALGELAIFRQVNKEEQRIHHDALEFVGGTRVLLTRLLPGQRATVLQLPAAPRTEQEAQEQRRVEFAG